MGIFNILPCIIKSRTNITRAHHVLEIHPDIVNLRNLLSDDLSFLRLGILQFLCLSLQRLKLQNKNIIQCISHDFYISLVQRSSFCFISLFDMVHQQNLP